MPRLPAPPSPPLPHKGGGNRLRQAPRQLLHPKSRTPPAEISLGWGWSRSRAARISFACIALPWAGRLSAIQFMARRRAAVVPDYTCTRARLWCRFTRSASRFASRRPHRCTCTNGCAPAAGRARCLRWWNEDAQPSSSIDRRLQPFGRGAVMLGAAEPAAGELGQDHAGGRQRLAIDLARSIPQLRTHDRLGALIEDAFDSDHQ